MRHAQILPLLLFLSSIILSCEQALSDQQTQQLTFESVTFLPSNIEYTSNVIKDTTLSVSFQGVLNQKTTLTQGIAYVTKGLASPLFLDVELQENGTFNAAGQLTLNTGETTTIRARIEFVEPNGQQVRFETSIPIEGVGDEAPVIESITHADSVRIPSSGSTSIFFIAEVSHAISLQNIASVTMELIDASSNESRGVFTLEDQGQDGDLQANDGQYFVGLSINQDNQPASYLLTWNATSVTGLSAPEKTTTLEVFR